MTGQVTAAASFTFPPMRWRWIGHLLLGILLGGSICFATAYDLRIGIAASLGLLALVPLCLRPDWMFAGFVLSIFWIEEFPGAMGETLERSIRSPFYSKSLGVPGLNAPDLMMLVLISVLMLRAFSIRRMKILWFDGIGAALVLLATAPIAALTANFITGNPFAHVDISETTGVAFDMSDFALRYIAVFQVKIFGYVFMAYVLGLLALQAEGAIERFIRLMAFAAVGMCVIGFVRLAQHPHIVLQVIPLFYHSPTSWLFALVIFYSICAWAFGLLSAAETRGVTVLCAVLTVFILISFRRTMWGGIALSAVILAFYLPSRPRRRIMILLGLFGTLGGCILLATPLQSIVLAPALTRLGQTSVDDTSTLYRLVLFLWFADNFRDIPVFGFGFAPLWNKIAGLGYFRVNLENIHSLYFWWWLRFGYYGLLAAFAALLLILREIFRIVAWKEESQIRAIGICALLALTILLFSGIFNPVYGEARYMIFAGLMLATISVLRRRQRAGARHGR